MRGRRWSLAWGAALLGFLLVAPPGLSVTGSGVFSSGLPVQLWGPLDAEAPGGGLVARGGAFDGSVLVQQGRVEVTRFELVLGPLGGLRRVTEVVAGSGALLELRPAAEAQLLALGDAALSTAGEARLALPRGDAFALEHGGAALALPYPARAAMVQVAEGVGTVEGNMHLFLTDAAVRLRRGPADMVDIDLRPTSLLRVDGADLDLAPAEGRAILGLADDLAGIAGAERLAELEALQVQEVLVKRVLEVKGEGLLVLRSRGADLHAFSRAPAVHVLGAAAFPGALGEVALLGRQVALRGEQAQAAGDFWIRAMPGEGAQRRMGLSGTFHSFAVNGRVVEAEPSAQAALALGALAALGLASPFLKPALRLFVPSYARIAASEVLGSEVRRRLYELVQAEPGLSLSELSQRSALSWGNTVHHLGVLRRSGLVVSMRHGRYRRWFAAGAVEQERRGQVAALRNPVSARIARLVLATPGLSQKQLADQLGMTPQAAHWHLVRLTQAGLVERVRDGREVRHYVRAAPPAMGPMLPLATVSAAAPAAPAPPPQPL